MLKLNRNKNTFQTRAQQPQGKYIGVLFMCLVLLGVMMSRDAYAVESGSESDSFNVHGVLVSDGGNPQTEVRLVNSYPYPVRFILPWGESTLSDIIVPADGVAYARVLLPPDLNNIRFDKLLTYHLLKETDDGTGSWVKFQEKNITVAGGWGINYNLPLNFNNCSIVTWFYDDTNKPRRGKQMEKDIEGSFRLLDNQTGLQFREVANAADADIIVEWISKSSHPDYGFSEDTIATAGGDSDGKTYIRLSAGAERLYDYYAGKAPIVSTEGAVTWVRTGRVWVVVHEIMHLLGFEHSEREESVMKATDFKIGLMGKPNKKNFKNTVVSKFSRGDLSGLQYLYSKNECR